MLNPGRWSHLCSGFELFIWELNCSGSSMQRFAFLLMSCDIHCPCWRENITEPNRLTAGTWHQLTGFPKMVVLKTLIPEAIQIPLAFSLLPLCRAAALAVTQAWDFIFNLAISITLTHATRKLCHFLWPLRKFGFEVRQSAFSLWLHK